MSNIREAIQNAVNENGKKPLSKPQKLVFFKLNQALYQPGDRRVVTAAEAVVNG